MLLARRSEMLGHHLIDDVLRVSSFSEDFIEQPDVGRWFRYPKEVGGEVVEAG